MIRDLIDVQWLKDHLNDQNIVIFDCRFRLSDPRAGRTFYEQGHIPGAYFLDLEEHLSGSKGTHGGRHPLPDEREFINLLRNSNVQRDSLVVAYDDQMAGSARLWFLLKYIGHDNVCILDGGIQEWIRAGLKLSRETPPHGHGNITPRIRNDIVAGIEEVKRLGNRSLIDCRERIRYRGIEEPIDKKAGHIPNAINIPYTDLLENNHYLDDAHIKSIFKDIPEGSIVYCGSGVTSCVNLFAMDRIGLKPKVYVGSWSDWISYDDNVISKE